MGRANKRRKPAGRQAFGNTQTGRAHRIASRHGLQSFASPAAAANHAREGSVILTMDSFGNLGGTVFLVLTPDGRGKLMPIEGLTAYASHLPLPQAGELLNIVKQYRAEQAGIRGCA